MDAEAVEAVEAGIKPEVLTVDTLAAAVDGGELWPFAGLGTKRPSHKYSYCENAPGDCEFYMCGPPMMNQSVINMLLDLGVDREDIMLDDFGG